MQSIIYQTQEQFDNLNERIHLAFQQTIPQYQGERYCSPIINVTTGELLFQLELEGIRGAIILGYVLTQEEKDMIVEISQDDENFFPKRDMEGII